MVGSAVAGFRTARPSSTTWLVAKTGAQIVVVWGAALWALPAVLVTGERVVGVPPLPGRRTDRAGVWVFLGGSALGLWAASAMTSRGRGTPLPFDAASQLVTTGPYALVRNPMAVSAVLQSAGVALARRSVLAATVPIVEIAVWELVLRPAEERFLHHQFGASYVEYRSRVRNWLPARPTA